MSEYKVLYSEGEFNRFIVKTCCRDERCLLRWWHGRWRLLHFIHGQFPLQTPRSHLPDHSRLNLVYSTVQKIYSIAIHILVSGALLYLNIRTIVNVPNCLTGYAEEGAHSGQRRLSDQWW